MFHTTPSLFSRCALLLAALLLAVVSLPAHAKRIALVVGNAAYQGETVLRNPVNDATDMAQTLGGLGLQVFEGKAHTNQTRQSMNALIGRFLDAAEGAELAVVYYAGHGIQSGGSSYMLPTDAQITDERSVRSEGLSLNDLLGDGADKRISRLVVILDACRNNPYTTRTRNTARGLAPPKETHGTLIAYATAHGQVADDGAGRNGVYTEQLLKQLKANGQRKSIRDLLEDTQLAVAQAKPGQLPKLYGDSALFRDVGLNGPVQLVSVVPVQTDPEQEAWDIAKRRDTVAAYQVYLNRYPSGRYAQTAQDALAGLQPAVAPSPQPTPQPATGNALDGRYQILASGAEVKDLQTGLVWQRCSVGQRWNGQTCAGEASKFTFDQAQALSRNGWRVPSKNALASLVDQSAGSPTIHAQAFPGTPVNWFWTSTHYASDSYYAWVVNFGNGVVFNSGRVSYDHVRLVR